MLFSLAGDYTPQSLKAMAEHPAENREAAAHKLLEAAGGKLVAIYGRSVNGPGVMAIIDVPDPDMATAIMGVAVASGSIHNPTLTRLFTMAEVSAIRQKRAKIAGAFKAPGQG